MLSYSLVSVVDESEKTSAQAELLLVGLNLFDCPFLEENCSKRSYGFPQNCTCGSQGVIAMTPSDLLW